MPILTGRAVDLTLTQRQISIIIAGLTGNQPDWARRQEYHHLMDILAAAANLPELKTREADDA